MGDGQEDDGGDDGDGAFAIGFSSSKVTILVPSLREKFRNSSSCNNRNGSDGGSCHISSEGDRCQPPHYRL